MFNSSEYIELKKQFDEYYHKKILPELIKAEATRKVYLRTFVVMSVLVLIWLAFSIYSQFSHAENLADKILSHMELINTIVVLVVCIPLYLYNRATKLNILSSIVNFFGKFNYTHNQIENDGLLTDLILSETMDKIEIDDNFVGTYEGVAVNITEYKKFELNTRRINGQIIEEYRKKGQSLLFVAQMNKKFEGKTIVMKDKGFLNKITKYENLQRVSLEDVEFEKKYEVYSDNQIEARYILTTAMINRMIHLSNIFPKMEYNFVNNKIIININTKKNMFECNSFFRTLINYNRIKRNFDEFYLIFSIIKIIKLNEKSIL